MKKFLAVLALTGAVSLMAVDIAPVIAKCTPCHGTAGEKKALGKSEIIKNLTKDQFIAALKGYQAGTYGKAMKNMMVMQVKKLDDAQIEALASHYIK